MGKKLLLIGNTSIHTYNYYHLVKPYFEEIYLITDEFSQGQEIEKIEFVSFSFRLFLQVFIEDIGLVENTFGRFGTQSLDFGSKLFF